jgi:hypothetical protein
VCYADSSGQYVLYLLVDKGKTARVPQLSRAVQVRLFKLGGDTRGEARARDASADDEAGVAFLPELIDVGDIDGDGLIEPVIVYRFYAQDGHRQGSEEYSGRIKIVMFYKGKKVVIRGVTGMLDGSRSTTANGNYFKLPAQAQSYLVKKVKQIYDKRQFGFDNSFGFKPRRE